MPPCGLSFPLVQPFNSKGHVEECGQEGILVEQDTFVDKGKESSINRIKRTAHRIKHGVCMSINNEGGSI